MTEDEYWDDKRMLKSETHCVQPEGAGGYLISNCAEYTIKRLRAQLQKATAVVEAGKGLRRYGFQITTTDGRSYLTEQAKAFDAALAEWERLK